MERLILPADPAALTPEHFCAAMVEIWGEDRHEQYAAWNDARRVLDAIGATWLYSAMLGQDSGYAYRLPAGGKVWVKTNGTMARALRATRGRPRKPATPAPKLLTYDEPAPTA